MKYTVPTSVDGQSGAVTLPFAPETGAVVTIQYYFNSSRDEYIKANLASEMRKYRGKKRLRKKKAKRALRMRWGFLQMGRLLASRRVNYAEIARKAFVVDPLPMPSGIEIYDSGIDIADVVTGGEE